LIITAEVGIHAVGVWIDSPLVDNEVQGVGHREQP
jgi:hypothetical protein